MYTTIERIEDVLPWGEDLWVHPERYLTDPPLFTSLLNQALRVIVAHMQASNADAEAARQIYEEGKARLDTYLAELQEMNTRSHERIACLEKYSEDYRAAQQAIDTREEHIQAQEAELAAMLQRCEALFHQREAQWPDLEAELRASWHVAMEQLADIEDAQDAYHAGYQYGFQQALLHATERGE